MKILDVLGENNLIICPNDYKKDILLKLNYLKKIVNISFMTLSEYKKNYLFSYDEKATLYLKNNYKLSVKNAKEILDNLIYIDTSKEYKDTKLNNLVKYKKELDENNLLIYNPIFKSYIANKNIIIYGYGKLDKFTLSLFNNPTIINDELIDKKYKVYEFNMMEEEVEYLYSSIFDLLEKGININKIFVLNYSKEYKAYFKRFNTYFDFKIDTLNDDSIIGTSITREFINDLDNLDKQVIYNKLINHDSKIANKLINIINNYAMYDLKEVKELIIEDINNTSINENKTNIVRLIDNNTIVKDDEYVFLIGFNDNYPNTKKDTEYLTDNLRKVLDLPLIEEENKLTKENTEVFISNINNLYLSYSKNSPFNTYNGQYLVNAKYDTYIPFNNYSKFINRLKYAYLLDSLDKYGIKDESLNNLYLNYDKNNYLEYDNSFKGLSDKQTKSINKLKLSYSSIDDYYKCAFKYYIRRILNITEFEGNYNTWVGNVFHGVLEDFFSDSKNFDFDNSFNTYLDNEINKNEAFKKESELYLINELKDELKKDIEVLKLQEANSLLDKVECEYKNEVKINDDVSFEGRIDKVVYRQNDETLAMVVDYKTGSSAKINKDYMQYGLSLQLPSYLYLLSNDDKFNKNLRFVGFYLQYLLKNSYKYDEKDIDSQRKENMKLNGYSNNDPSIVSVADTSIVPGASSETIKSYKLNGDGSVYARSSVLSNEDMNALIKLVNDKILEASNNILNGNFKINPKIINGKNESCKYCEYKEICFRRYDDNVYYKVKDEDNE